MTEVPVFAVVGHPNKGKTSVVAALTQDDSLAISPLSGTTRQAQRFPMELGEQRIYELVDTPGFQRARACLDWLESEPGLNAGQRPARVQAFVEHFGGTGQFEDEVELLRPVCAGANIVYVVDGSLPYSPEYEAEMEILRWTARPRLALINPIEDDTFVDEWRTALSQYFSLVRVFDPMKAGFEQHLQLLRTFGELGSPGQLDRAVDEMQRHRQMQLRLAAELIVDRLYRLLSFHVDASGRALDTVLRGDPLADFNRSLNDIEQTSREALQGLFLHKRIQASMQKLQFVETELMDRESWSLWGLGRGQLTVIAAAAGSSIGLAADLAAGGQSLMLGGLGGGALGALSGWLGTDLLHAKLPAWLPYHRQDRQLGPVSDPNFGFVILGRALQHATAMLTYSHADRRPLAFDAAGQNRIQQLPRKQQVQLLKWCRQLRTKGLQSPAAGHLEAWVAGELVGQDAPRPAPRG